MLDPTGTAHWRERYRPYTTSRGIEVIPLYRKAVPKFDPERDGGEWERITRSALGDRKFRQEHEVEFGAAEGGLVYPKWDMKRHVLYQMPILLPDWTYFCAIDPGVRVTAALWGAITPPDPISYIYLFDEYYEGDSVKDSEDASAVVHGTRIRRKTQMICDKVHGAGVKKNAQDWIDATLIDPSAWRREGSADDRGSVAQRYIEAGVESLVKAINDVDGGIERVKDFETPQLDIPHPNGIDEERLFPGMPKRGFPIKYSAPYLQHYMLEKKYYRYAMSRNSQSLSETSRIQKAKDHLMDCERYMCVHIDELPDIAIAKPKQTRLDKFYEKLLTPKEVSEMPLINALLKG